MLLHAADSKVSEIIRPGSLEAASLKIEQKIRGLRKVWWQLCSEKLRRSKKPCERIPARITFWYFPIENRRQGPRTEWRVHLKYAWRDLGTSKSHHSSENLFPVLFVWNFQSSSEWTMQIFWFRKVHHDDDSQGEQRSIFFNHHHGEFICSSFLGVWFTISLFVRWGTKCYWFSVRWTFESLFLLFGTVSTGFWLLSRLTASELFYLQSDSR